MWLSTILNDRRRLICANLCRLKHEQAQALVELAFVVPVLILLLIGVTELAHVTYGAIEVSNAAKAAVEYGAQNSITAADITGMQTAAAKDAGNVSLGPTTVSVSCICSDGSASTCSLIDCSSSHTEKILTVKTQATLDPLIYVPGLPKNFTLYGQAVQKCLQC